MNLKLQEKYGRILRGIAVLTCCGSVMLGLNAEGIAQEKVEKASNKIMNEDGLAVMAYFPEWGGISGEYTVWDVPAENLTHLFYAFARLEEDGRVEVDNKDLALKAKYPDGKGVKGVKGHLGQLVELKKAYPHLKTIASIGGWELSMHFSGLAKTKEGRIKVARNAVEFMRKYEFDGVDIDWEFPVVGSKYKDKQCPEDKKNYTLLMQEIRNELDLWGSIDGKKYLLTSALTVSPYRQKHLEIEKLSKLFDFINVMVYDMHGRWVKDKTGHLSALYPSKAIKGIDPNISGDAGIKGYLKGGFAPKQIMLGAPLYAAGWKGVNHEARGCYQDAKALAYGGTIHKGYFEWNYIVPNLLEKQGDKYKLEFDADSKSAFVWAEDVDGGTWITCPSKKSYQAKIDYVREYGLGGMFFWDVSNDMPDPKHEQALITFTADQLMRRKEGSAEHRE